MFHSHSITSTHLKHTMVFNELYNYQFIFRAFSPKKETSFLFTVILVG